MAPKSRLKIYLLEPPCHRPLKRFYSIYLNAHCRNGLQSNQTDQLRKCFLMSLSFNDLIHSPLYIRIILRSEVV